MLNLALKSKEDRKNSTDMHDSTQMPATKKLINKACLKKKQSILNNIPKPTIYCDLSLPVMSPKYAAKNALVLDINVRIMQANNALMDLQSIKHDYLNEGLGI